MRIHFRVSFGILFFMKLYHISENSGIQIFHPHSPVHRPEIEPAVWAVNQHFLPLFMLSRDCPRVTFWPISTTTAQDKDRYWEAVSSDFVIVVEWGWLDRILATTLHRYTFDSEFFELEDPLDSAGYHGVYISRHTVSKESVESIHQPLHELSTMNVEVRFCDRLFPLHTALHSSTMHVSSMRMRNAAR